MNGNGQPSSVQPQRAVIYTRVSREQQTENTSLAGQFAACRKKADEIGAQVVGFYEETISGALYEARPGIQSALADIEAGRASLLICARLDRSGRDLDDLRDIRRRVEEAGGQLVFADGLQFEQNATGKLLFTQLGAFAEFERELIKERTYAGLRRRAEAGSQPARARAPFGYRIVTRADVTRGEYSPGSEGSYHLVEEKARWVKLIFERYDAGHSLESIADWLQAQNVAPPGAARSQSQVWFPPTVRGILLNPVYAGRPAWRKTRSVQDQSRRARGLKKLRVSKLRPEHERIYLQAPAIVSETLWARVQDRLADSQRKQMGRTDRRYMLSGLLRCPSCHRRLSCSTTRSKVAGRRPSFQYRCDRAPRNDDEARNCPMQTRNGYTLESLAVAALVALSRQPALVEAAYRDRQREIEAQRRALGGGTERKRLEIELRDVEARELVAANAKIEARLEGRSERPFDAALEALASKRRTVESALAALRPLPVASKSELRDHSAFLISVAHELEVVLLSPDVDGATKHRLLSRVVEAIYPIGGGLPARNGRPRKDVDIEKFGICLRLVVPLGSEPICALWINGELRVVVGDGAGIVRKLRL